MAYTYVDRGDDSAATLGNLLNDLHHHTGRPAVQTTRGLVCQRTTIQIHLETYSINENVNM